MTFLNPLLLFGLAAAAIPLIIHLFNFRKPKRLDFSSLAFLKELQKTTMQRVRIKQWLLLVLRTLAIACLVLAFARPTLTSGIGQALGGRATTSMALVIDNSPSMALRDAQGAYLDQAQTQARTLIGEKEPGDEVYIVPTADQAKARPAAYTNRGPALDAADAVAIAPGVTPLARAIARAGGLLDEATNLNKEIYILSDLQQSTLLDSIPTPLPAGIRPILLPIGTRTYANVAVTDVRVVSRIVEEGQPVRIEATLVNHGTEAIQGYVASVYLEGERVAQASADLEPGLGTTVSFAATPQRRGWLGGVVQIEDDAFEQDNVRYFTLNVPERRRVLLVQGDSQRINYLELALSSNLTQGRVVFEVKTIAEQALAATALGGYDAVILVGPRTLSSGEVGTLVQYVTGGGGLILFPGAAAQASDYNALLRGLGGGQFSGFSGGFGPGPTVAAFDRVDLEHPLFEGVFGRQAAARARQLESPEIYYTMNYTARGGTEQTLIQLSNQFPFLQEIRKGRGTAFLIAVAPDPQWSDLPVRGLFVPLMYRTLYYVSAGEAIAGEQLQVGQPGELRVAGYEGQEPLELVAPDGERFTPEQRSLFGATLVQVTADLQQPGVYDLRAGETPVRRVAFNLTSTESDLRVYAPQEAAQRLGEALGQDVTVLDVDGSGAEGLRTALEAERRGIEIWNVFLMAALLFLVAEMLVARQWRPEAIPT